jgi:hypothetical protein
MASAQRRIQCREICAADIEQIARLLHAGFPERSRDHWMLTLNRLAVHATPEGYPKFGYLLAIDDVPVGVLLIIFSSMVVGSEVRIRGNVASWYVAPQARIHATMLTSRALAYKNVTFLNITPAKHTWPILEAQGFRAFGTGQFKALSVFCLGPRGARVTTVSAETAPGDDLSSADIALLLHHASYGCISVICTVAKRRYPFVFLRRLHEWKSTRVPVSFALPHALLVYCRSLDEFVRFAGPLSRFLAWRGMPLVFIESSGPIRGLIGKFSVTGPKFFRGPHPPHIGDIAYTERVMFGL